MNTLSKALNGCQKQYDELSLHGEEDADTIFASFLGELVEEMIQNVLWSPDIFKNKIAQEMMQSIFNDIRNEIIQEDSSSDTTITAAEHLLGIAAKDGRDTHALQYALAYLKSYGYRAISDGPLEEMNDDCKS